MLSSPGLALDSNEGLKILNLIMIFGSGM